MTHSTPTAFRVPHAPADFVIIGLPLDVTRALTEIAGDALDLAVLRIAQRILEELRCSKYRSTARYALRDFGSGPTFGAAIEWLLATGAIELVETSTRTTRFPGVGVGFYRAAN